MPNNKWHIILGISHSSGQPYSCRCIKSTENTFELFDNAIEEEPFYVAEDIWELSYGVQLMTLHHASLKDHPAMRLWQQWQSQENKG